MPVTRLCAPFGQPLAVRAGCSALEQIGVVNALDGLELRKHRPQLLDRGLIIIPEALYDARQDRFWSTTCFKAVQ